jgi:hypothetical protein
VLLAECEDSTPTLDSPAGLSWLDALFLIYFCGFDFGRIISPSMSFCYSKITEITRKSDLS